MDAVLGWARRLASQPRLPTALAKAALDNGIDTAFGASLGTEVAHALVTDGVARDRDNDAALAASRARNSAP
jgi:hypothetical protein